MSTRIFFRGDSLVIRSVLGEPHEPFIIANWLAEKEVRASLIAMAMVPATLFIVVSFICTGSPLHLLGALCGGRLAVDAWREARLSTVRSRRGRGVVTTGSSAGNAIKARRRLAELVATDPAWLARRGAAIAAGHERRRQQNGNAARNADIVARRAVGDELKAIGALYGLSHQRVHQICKAASRTASSPGGAVPAGPAAAADRGGAGDSRGEG